MHRYTAASALQTASAETMLGRDHPLARVLEQMAISVDGLAVVTATLSGAVAALVAGVAGALAVVIGSVAAEAALGGVFAILVSDRRACVRDLIIEGRGSLPLRVVERERRRLTARKTRLELAESLVKLAREARRQPAHSRHPRALYAPAVVAAAGPELEAVARLLAVDGVSAAGVALAERLLGGHDSPLYGREPDRLRDELHRTAFTLRAGPDRCIATRSSAHC